MGQLCLLCYLLFDLPNYFLQGQDLLQSAIKQIILVQSKIMTQLVQ